MGFYLYRIKFYDDLTENEAEGRGVTYAGSYAEAMDNIADYYGEDNIIDVEELFALEGNSVLELSKDVCDGIRKGEYL